MASRNELRGFLKQSQRSSEIEDESLQPTSRDNDNPVGTKHSSHNRKECVNENDELVKYMSKLPGYLQRIESNEEESDHQSNVLNVGVLDWGRLEKWKHGRARDGERLGKTERKVSNKIRASTSEVVVVPNDSHRCSEIDNDKLRKVKVSRDLQHSVQHEARCALESELASRDSLNKREIATCSYNKSSSRDHERVNPVKSRRSRSYQESGSGLLLSEMGNSGGKGDKETRKQEARESGKQCVEKSVIDREEKKKVVGDSKGSLLLRSIKQSGEPQMSLDDVRAAEEVNVRSQIPRSCPLSFDLERDSEDMVLPNLSGEKERRNSKTASRIFDQELREEDDSRKNRDPSPSKRFSFSFGRLSRSFSSKEEGDDTIIKSESMRFNGGPVRQSQSSNPVEKQSGSRISPFRRLLKSKVSENAKPLPSRRTRALFHLTIRNGIPLFHFVVDDDDSNNNNNRSVLGATMKNSSSFKDDDSVRYCTFYSVNEVKKKKTWLIHGGHNKEKQRGFVYNIIGQMRLSKNSISVDLTGNIRESVLFDESEQIKGRKEIAAVVIKKKPVEEEEEAITVIIPGGVHSLPEKGGPSPLISRWRSGGLCDCGGWDVECKLRVLSNKTSSFLREFDQSFKLFNQEGSEDESGPVLEMTEVQTGIYRVEFGSFLSPIQAFFVCVTVITCGSEDTVVKTAGKSSSPFAPPLSPVGRV